MRTNVQPSGQLFSKRWPLSNPNLSKSIVNKHKAKHHRNSDTKTGNRDHIRTTALERSVMNYWGGLRLVLRMQPHLPSLMWYKHLDGFSVRTTILLVVNESSRSTNKSSLITMKKQRRGLNRYTQTEKFQKKCTISENNSKNAFLKMYEK